MRDILLKLTEHAELTGEPVPGLPIVEIAGDCRVLVENHVGVTQYSPEHIGIKMKYGGLCIHGFGLELARMTKEQLVITGRIDSVTLMRRGK